VLAQGENGVGADGDPVLDEDLAERAALLLDNLAKRVALKALRRLGQLLAVDKPQAQKVPLPQLKKRESRRKRGRGRAK
jgi:hypothetical protein